MSSLLIEEKKSNVSFGTTRDREIFPSSVPHNRLASDLNPITGAPNRGPGTYENEDMTNMWHDIEHKIASTKGYTMGARTAPRFGGKEYINQSPAPTAYQQTTTQPKTFSPEYKPFKSGSERFPSSRRDILDANPGPGRYEHETQRNRHVEYHQNFGGQPINIPTVSHKSTISRNTDKLMSTTEEKRYQKRLAYLKLFY